MKTHLASSRPLMIASVLLLNMPSALADGSPNGVSPAAARSESDTGGHNRNKTVDVAFVKWNITPGRPDGCHWRRYRGHLRRRGSSESAQREPAGEPERGPDGGSAQSAFATAS